MRALRRGDEHLLSSSFCFIRLEPALINQDGEKSGLETFDQYLEKNDVEYKHKIEKLQEEINVFTVPRSSGLDIRSPGAAARVRNSSRSLFPKPRSISVLRLLYCHAFLLTSREII